MNLPQHLPKMDWILGYPFTNLLFGYFEFGTLSIAKDIMECISIIHFKKTYGDGVNIVDTDLYPIKNIKVAIIEYNNQVIVSFFEISNAQEIRDMIYKDPRNKSFYIHIWDILNDKYKYLNNKKIWEYKNLDQTITSCLVELFNNSNIALSITQKKDQEWFTISEVTKQ